MARAPKYSDDEARALILESARSVFSRRGFRQASMEEIAAGSDAGKPLVYRYYPSKADLYDAVVQECIEHLAEPVLDMMRSQWEAPDFIRRAVVLCLDGVQEHPSCYAILSNTDSTRPAAARQRIDDVLQDFLGGMVSLLEEHTGVTDPVRNTTFAEMLLAALQAGIHRVVLAEDEETRASLTQLMLGWAESTTEAIVRDFSVPEHRGRQIP